MILAQYSNITFGYHDKHIVSDFSLQLKSRCRIGLVGNNGTGKTTLLRLLSGELEPDSGAVQWAKDLKIGYLRQTPDVPYGTDLRTILEQPFQAMIEIEKQLEVLRQTMGSDSRPEILERYDCLQEQFERDGGYQFRSRIDRVFNGLGFVSSEYDRPIESFSGGEQARVMLAKLLLEAPDLMLLDEPTNHLDINAVEYLENYLEEYGGGAIIISHDRYFLDRVTTNIVELFRQKCRWFNGNYSFFREEKERQDAVHHKHFKLQQAKVNKLEDFVRRNMAAQKTKQAQSRLKELQKIDRMEDIKGPARQMQLKLNMKRPSGQIVFELEGLWKGFDGETLFENTSLRLHRGEVIGVIGPNGSGKSTLLRILTDDLQPDQGNVQWGYQVYPAFYDQHLRDLDEHKQVIDEVWQLIPNSPQQEVRDHLGRFLFSGDDVFDLIGPLSGGEKARVALAKLFLKDANLLLLDEPTNHLDLPARESLEAALKQYPGTVVLVTHDRYLLDRIADRIWSLEDKVFTEYLGNYSDYKHFKSIALQVDTTQNRQSSNTKNGKPEHPPKSKKEQRKARADLRRKTGKSAAYYEKEIERLESELELIKSEMRNPVNATDWNALKELGQTQTELTTQLNKTMDLWETAAEAESELDG